jgi:hypothetical protein
MPIAIVEQAVAHQLHDIKLTPANRIALQREVRAQLRYEVTNDRAEVTRQEKRLSRLLVERQRVLEAYYDEAVSRDMLGNEQRRINKEIAALQEIVDEATKARSIAQQSYRAALALATTLNLERAYMNAHPLLRRCLNQALFARIVVDDTQAITIIGSFGRRKEHRVKVTNVELHPEINNQRLAQAVIGLTLTDADLLTISPIKSM